MKRNFVIKWMPFLALLFITVLTAIIDPVFATVAASSLAIVPIWGVIKDNTFRVLSGEEVEALKVEDKLKYYNDLNAYREKQISDLKEQSKALKGEAVQEAKSEIFTLQAEMIKAQKEQAESIYKAMDAMGLEIQYLKGNRGDQKQTLEKFFAKEENKSKLVGIVKGGSRDLMIIKADTLRTSITSRPEYYDESPLGQLATKRLRFWDLFPKIKLPEKSADTVAWWEWDDATTVRAAAVVAEGGTFPESTAKWVKATEPLVKVGDTIPVSEEFETDMSRFAAELTIFLGINVDLIVDQQLYNGSGSGGNIKGVYTSATAWTAGTTRVANATLYDLIVLVRADITKNKGGAYSPDFIALNSDDIADMKLEKDANQNYILPPFVSANGQIIDQMTVVESGAVTTNTLLIGDSRFANIFYKDGYEISKGLVNAQFNEDMLTIKARKRCLMRVKTNDQAAFRKVASISAELTTLSS